MFSKRRKKNENFSAYGDTATRKERKLWLLSTETEDRMNQKIRKLTLCALFAALSYVVFTFLQIKIPIGTDATSVHLGNAVVVIGALILGGPLGGIDPTIGYVYKVLLLGKSAAKAAFHFSLFATAFNAVTSTIVATAVYMGLYRVLRREQLSLG